jgi:ABC-type antimicrobial peptide transport system permease subunit
MAEIIEKLKTLPQVEAIAHGSSPLDGFGIKLLTKLDDNEGHSPYLKRIDHRYFKLIEQPLLQGENFTKLDRRDNNYSMIVNQAFAKQLTPDGDVIGMRLVSINEPEFKIIGIVKDIAIPGDTPFGSDDVAAPIPRAYVPDNLNDNKFILKIKADQSISRQQLGKLLAEVDARYSVFSFKSADEMLTQNLFTQITTAVTTTALTLITFFLAGIGLYGILSYSTQMRRFEIGTRMAIGAKRGDLILLIIKENVKPIIAGVLFSLVILLSVYFFFSVELSSYITAQLTPLFLVTLVLISTLSLLACYLPLRRFINSPAISNLQGSE